MASLAFMDSLMITCWLGSLTFELSGYITWRKYKFSSATIIGPHHWSRAITFLLPFHKSNAKSYSHCGPQACFSLICDKNCNPNHIVWLLCSVHSRSNWLCVLFCRVWAMGWRSEAMPGSGPPGSKTPSSPEMMSGPLPWHSSKWWRPLPSSSCLSCAELW